MIWFEFLDSVYLLTIGFYSLSVHLDLDTHHIKALKYVAVNSWSPTIWKCTSHNCNLNQVEANDKYLIFTFYRLCMIFSLKKINYFFFFAKENQNFVKSIVFYVNINSEIFCKHIFPIKCKMVIKFKATLKSS